MEAGGAGARNPGALSVTKDNISFCKDVPKAKNILEASAYISLAKEQTKKECKL